MQQMLIISYISFPEKQTSVKNQIVKVYFLLLSSQEMLTKIEWFTDLGCKLELVKTTLMDKGFST